MGGTHRTLAKGTYHLQVRPGEGPAGVRRSGGEHVEVDVHGGAVDFEVGDAERVYFWWRGETRRAGVELRRRREPLPAPRSTSRRGPRGVPSAPPGRRAAGDPQVA